MIIVFAFKVKSLKIVTFFSYFYLYTYIFFSCKLTCLPCFTLIAGYNNLEVAEYLLEHGADVNAQDKGGLIPLHNAASYGVSMLEFKWRKLP